MDSSPTCDHAAALEKDRAEERAVMQMLRRGFSFAFAVIGVLGLMIYLIRIDVL
jgi:hypothetical protein